MRTLRLLVVFGGIAALCPAQPPAPAPKKLGPVAVSGSLRTRLETWDWFEGDANSTYTFSGSILRLSFGQNRKAVDWQLEAALPILLGLPGDAIGPGAQGQLGLGAIYWTANQRSRNAAPTSSAQKPPHRLGWAWRS